MHGTVSPGSAGCETLQVPPGDYIKVLTLNFDSEDGLHFVLFQTKLGGTIKAGLPDNDSEMETLVFD